MKEVKRKLANEVELPYDSVIVKKLQSNHSNVPRICQGMLSTNPIRVGHGLHVSGDLGVTTTPIVEIEMLDDGGVQIKTRNSTYIVYDRNNFNEKVTLSDMR